MLKCHRCTSKVAASEWRVRSVSGSNSPSSSMRARSAFSYRTLASRSSPAFAALVASLCQRIACSTVAGSPSAAVVRPRLNVQRLLGGAPPPALSIRASSAARSSPGPRGPAVLCGRLPQRDTKCRVAALPINSGRSQLIAARGPKQALCRSSAPSASVYSEPAAANLRRAMPPPGAPVGGARVSQREPLREPRPRAGGGVIDR